MGLGLRRRRLGQGDFQNALLEFHLDLLCINLARQPRHALERAEGTLYEMLVFFGFLRFRFFLALDRQHVVGKADIDTFS